MLGCWPNPISRKSKRHANLTLPGNRVRAALAQLAAWCEQQSLTCQSCACCASTTTGAYGLRNSACSSDGLVTPTAEGFAQVCGIVYVHNRANSYSLADGLAATSGNCLCRSDGVALQQCALCSGLAYDVVVGHCFLQQEQACKRCADNVLGGASILG